MQTAQIKARRLLRADEFVSFSQKLHGWLSISAASLTRKYTGRFKCCGKCHCQRADLEKGQKKKRKEAGASQSLRCTETTFLFFFFDFPTVTRPVIWGKCFKKSIIITRKCGFYSKTLPTTAMWKWNVALATRGTAAWESERDIKLTEGVIAQRPHFCWSCILFIRARYYTNNGGLGIVLTTVISVLLNSRLDLTSAHSEFRHLKIIGINKLETF